MEENTPSVHAEKVKHKKSTSVYKYPNDISKYKVTQTLGAGTFGRVKQIVSPTNEVLALKQISKSHIINLKQV